MTFQKEKNAQLNKKPCKVVIMGHLIEVTQCERLNQQSYITKLDEKYYIDNRTGEVKEYIKSESRADSMKNVRESMKKVRYLVNNNFCGADDEYHVILTYKENMQDTKKLMRDMEVFLKRLRRHFSGFSYLYVVEPQKRGAWHTHLLLKGISPGFNFGALWEHGTRTFKRSLKDIDNIGAYLSAYLTNTETKKGGRLHMYPPNLKIFRHSRDIEYPEVITMSAENAKKIVGPLQADYSETITLTSDDGQPINEIRHLYYNKRREQSQSGTEPQIQINNYGTIHITLGTSLTR